MFVGVMNFHHAMFYAGNPIISKEWQNNDQIKTVD
jgi:hypothetical protein